MIVILQQDVPKLGNVGDIVKVRDGFGRNFLVPRGLAVIADERNVRRLEHQKRMAAAKAARLGGEPGSTARAASPALSSTSTATAGTARDLDSLSQFTVWELHFIYGQRDYDPEKLSTYEQRNGVSAGNGASPLACLALALALDTSPLASPRPHPRLALALAWAAYRRPLSTSLSLVAPCFADREKERALLAFAHFKEDANDSGRSVHGWINLEDMLKALGDAELSVLDDYMQNNTSAEWKEERTRLREAIGDPSDDRQEQ